MASIVSLRPRGSRSAITSETTLISRNSSTVWVSAGAVTGAAAEDDAGEDESGAGAGASSCIEWPSTNSKWRIFCGTPSSKIWTSPGFRSRMAFWCLSRTTKSRRTSEVVVRRVGTGSCAGAIRGRKSKTQSSFRIVSDRTKVYASIVWIGNPITLKMAWKPGPTGIACLVSVPALPGGDTLPQILSGALIACLFGNCQRALRRLHGLFGLVGFRIHESEERQALLVFATAQVHRFLEVGQRFTEIACGGQHAAQIELKLERIRVQFHGPAQIGDGIGQVPGSGQVDAQRVVRLRGRWIDFERGAALLDAVLHTVPLQECGSQADMSAGVSRIGGNRFLVALNRFVHLSGAGQGQAQIGVDGGVHGIARVLAQGRLVFHDGVGLLSFPLQRQAEVVMGSRIAGIKFDGLPEMHDRVVRLPIAIEACPPIDLMKEIGQRRLKRIPRVGLDVDELRNIDRAVGGC